MLEHDCGLKKRRRDLGLRHSSLASVSAVAGNKTADFWSVPELGDQKS